MKKIATSIILILLIHNTAFSQKDLIRKQADADAIKDMSPTSPVLWMAHVAGTGALLIFSGIVVLFEEFMGVPMCIGVTTVSIAILNSNSAPPTGRFIGKSPEYIKTYTDAYKAKVINRRLKNSCLGGSIVGYAFSIPSIYICTGIIGTKIKDETL